MQKMKTKIMGTLAILIIGLSVAGIVYAHWTDTATIKGTVHMGSITFGFSGIIAEWDAEDYYDYATIKRTASTVCTLSDLVTDAHTGCTVNKTLTFTMVNATPEYWGINKFNVSNAGTIPVKIQGITLILPAGLYYYQYDSIVWDVYNETTDDFLYEIWLYNETDALHTLRQDSEFEFAPPWMVWGYVDLVGIIGIQIDRCGKIPVEMCVYLPETAQECHTYTFSMEIEAIQWNKYVVPP